VRCRSSNSTGSGDVFHAAGAAAVVNTALTSAKQGATLVTVAVHKRPEPIDLSAILRSEMTILGSQGYPTEIFEVTPEIAAHQDRFARLISHRVPFPDAARAFQGPRWLTAGAPTAGSPSAATSPAQAAPSTARFPAAAVQPGQ
jgi:threonine dehydrogenase-like Zn-dependent dehydrogenase